MSKKNKNKNVIPAPAAQAITETESAPANLNDPNTETDVNLNDKTPAAVSETPAEITEKEFVPGPENAPEGFGWCAICKRHIDLQLLNSTSERNVYACKAFCKVKNNIVNLAAGADAAARTASKRSKGSKSSEPRPPSKVSKIVAYIADKNMFTVKEISEISGHDLKNASVSLTILKNPARTKNPIPFYYSAAHKVWLRVGYDPSSGKTTEPAPSVEATPDAANAQAEETPQA